MRTEHSSCGTRIAKIQPGELARHSIGEELVVYPAMEKYMGDDGVAKANHDREEHQQVSLFLCVVYSIDDAY